MQTDATDDDDGKDSSDYRDSDVDCSIALHPGRFAGGKLSRP